MSNDLWFLDDIRDAVNAPDTVDVDLIREASVAYNDTCRDANKRLRQVDKLLRDGLRSEAIQAAELEPSLLTLIADLDFPYLEEWQGMLAQWNLQLPPQLEMDIAVRLNAAYAEIRPLEQLLKQHRLLALARAPLSARIEVLRNLNALDELNFSWESDLIEYERLRLRQIKSEAEEAAARGDLERLTELQDELNGSKWISEVPSGLTKTINLGYHSLVQDDARRQLEDLIPLLDQSYSEFDVARAAELSSKWSDCASIVGLSPEDPLSQRTSEAIGWVNDQLKTITHQNQFEAELQLLESALEQDDPKQKLESHLLKLQRFDLPIPESLLNRVQDRISVQTAHAHRRGRLIGATVVASLVVIAVSSFAYWSIARERSVLIEHRTQLSEYVDKSSWLQAQSYFSSLPEDIKQDPEINSLNTKVASELKNEEQRLQSLTESFKKAESQSIETLNQSTLDQISELVNTEQEQQRLAELKYKLRDYNQQQQNSRDEAFLETITKWSEKLANLERHKPLDEPAMWSLLTKLQQELESHSGVTSSLRKRGNILENKVRAIIKQLGEAENERRLMSAVYSSVGQIDLFNRALQTLIKEKPNTLAATYAKQVLEDEEAWLSIIKWNQFWTKQRPNWTKLSSKSAGEIIAAGDDLSEHSLKNTLSNEFEKRKPYLEKVVKRKDIDIAELKYPLSQSKFMNNLWMIVDTDNQRYYCPKAPENISDRTLRIEYLVDSTNPPKTRTLPPSKVAWKGRAPQNELADFAKNKLQQLGDDNWDKTFYALANKIKKQLAMEPSLDPVLGLDLLRRVLQTGCDGSSHFEEIFQDVIEEIDNSGIDFSVAWYLPGDEEAQEARQNATAVVDGFVDFQELAKSKREFFLANCLPPSESLTWVGVLGRKQDSTWKCFPSLPDTATGMLVIATPRKDKKVSLTSIAKVESGNASWSISPDSIQALGTPLFLQSKTATNNSP